jgi:hypothetical protein
MEGLKMKLLQIIFIILMCASIAFSASNPQPVYGNINPNTKITATSDAGTISTVSDYRGDYILELTSDYQKTTFTIKGCTKTITLPQKAAYKFDYTCNVEAPKPIDPVILGVGGAAAGVAVIAAIVIATKKKTTKKAKK